MRRTLLAILLIASTCSALASTALAATSQARIDAILRDCEDDGTLSGDYRPSELRDAVRNIGTDLDQYSDCRDVISAAVLRAVAARNGGGAGAAGGGGSGSTGGAGAAGSPAASGGSDGATAGADPNFGAAGTLAPQDRGEIDALEDFRHSAPAATSLAGSTVDVGAPRGVAAVVAHDLPTPVVVALIALAVSGLGAAVPSLHRRVTRRAA